MRESLVVTLIGDDRPGIVARLAALAAEGNASWQQSHMARLAGRFAGIVRLEAAAEALEQLERDLRQLEAEGLRLTIERGAPAGSPEPLGIVIDLIGHDREGIVRDVSAALARHGASIVDLETEVESASMSGEQLFKARAEVRLPEGTAIEALRTDLEGIADELMVDLSVGEHGAPAAAPASAAHGPPDA